MKGKCKNCGGDYGIHKFDTLQCPFGGVEAGPNRPDTWVGTHYEEEDTRVDELVARIAKLENQVAALLDAVPSARRENLGTRFTVSGGEVIETNDGQDQSNQSNKIPF